MKKTSLITGAALIIAGCASKTIQYPAEQTTSQLPGARSSTMTIAKSAYDFTDADIRVPANFDTQGLQFCGSDFGAELDESVCPLDKKAIRIYFGENKTNSKFSAESTALAQINNQTLGLMLESQLAGVNRFRIVTNDNAVIETEQEQQFAEQDSETLIAIKKSTKVLRPDYAVKIDTVKTADRFYGEYNGLAQYHIEMTTSVIDPYTKEKLAYPNLGKIRVKGTDVRAKESFVYTNVNDRYYSGFDYSDQANVQAVFNQMASKAFDVLLSRLLVEMPSSAQVMAFKNNQATLDRGRNAGILNNETMILFQYNQGFVEPIAVARVKPSRNSAIAEIVKWKDSKVAEALKEKASDGIVKLSGTNKVFAVSVGLPADYVQNRL